MEAMTRGRIVDKYLGQGERKWFFFVIYLINFLKFLYRS
jgi:hypothetical protein